MSETIEWDEDGKGNSGDVKVFTCPKCGKIEYRGINN